MNVITVAKRFFLAEATLIIEEWLVVGGKNEPQKQEESFGLTFKK
jgi:hypothetical protein